MQKTSITYERCSDGLERKSEKYQNILISNFSSYIKQVIDLKMLFLDMKEVEDLLIRSMCQQYGTQSHVAVPIFDDKQHLIAILSLDWVFSDVPQEYISENKFNKFITEDLLKEVKSLKNYI
jgi:hypothetical protein